MSNFYELIGDQFDGPGNITFEYYNLLQSFRALVTNNAHIDTDSSPDAFIQLQSLESLLLEVFIAIKSNESVGIDRKDDMKKMLMIEVEKNIDKFDLLTGDIMHAIDITLPGHGLCMDHASEEYKYYEEIWLKAQPCRLEKIFNFNIFQEVIINVCNKYGYAIDISKKLAILLYDYLDFTNNQIVMFKNNDTYGVDTLIRNEVISILNKQERPIDFSSLVAHINFALSE
jgi:hypothetical protein